MEVNFIIATILILLSICSCIANLFLAYYHLNTGCANVANPLMICCMITIFLVSVVYGLLPYFFNRRCHHENSDKPLKKSEIFVSLLNCFAGGVIFGISILDIWNDTEKQFQTNFKGESHYPWVKMLVGVGFLSMSLIDELISSAFASNKISCDQNGPPKRKMTIMNFDFGPHDLQQLSDKGSQEEPTDFIRDVTVAMFNHVPKIGLKKSPSNETTTSLFLANTRKNEKQFSIASSSTETSLNTETEITETTAFQSVNIQEKSHTKLEKIKKMERSIQIILVVSTFLFHSFLEGLALGSEWNPEQVVHMSFIIVIHKSMLMWNAGVNLSKKFHGSFKLFLLSLILLSVVTPLGALITYSIQKFHFIDYYEQNMLSTALHCFSISMFLFLAIFEIMAQEQQKKYSNFLKMVAYVAGFSLIAVFVQIIETMHENSKKHGLQPAFCR